MPLNSSRPFLISPPFGSYFRDRRAYSVLGSFTRYARPGRTGQVARTVRPVPGGWVNKVGLRNGGDLAMADALGRYRPGQIVSVAIIDGDAREWAWLVNRVALESYPGRDVIFEVNVSCPNTDHARPALPSEAQMRVLEGCDGVTVVWKLPPVESAAIEAVSYLAGLGARYFHLSNTLPSPVGGISGAPLREVNLGIVERRAAYLSQRFPLAVDRPEIVAGGGIYTPEHLLQYTDAGAARFSLSTAWFWPPRAWRTMRKDA